MLKALVLTLRCILAAGAPGTFPTYFPQPAQIAVFARGVGQLPDNLLSCFRAVAGTSFRGLGHAMHLPTREASHRNNHPTFARGST